MNSSQKERLLIKKFLEEYKKIVEDRTKVPFNPRSLVIIAQPDLDDSTLFEWWSYNKWFDELDVGVCTGKNRNLLEIFLEIPLQLLIAAEESGYSLISKKNEKKLAKVLKLINEIRLEPQNEKDKI
jgi:hypothetical protein